MESTCKRIRDACKTFCMTGQIMSEYAYIRLMQYMHKNVSHLDKDRSVLTYELDGRLYKIILNRRRGPPVIHMVIDQDDNDVSELVLPYMGPLRDWHNRELTPEFWGKKSLVFHLANGEEITCTEKQFLPKF